MNAKKLWPPLGSIFVLGLTWTFLAAPVQASTFTWDSSGTGGTFDGGGTWSTANANWWNASTDVSWSPSGTDTAIFGSGGAGPFSVNVSGSVGVGGIAFNSGSLYNISGGSIALNSATITMNATSGTIASILTGSTGLAVSGSGLLALTGTNVYSGGTTIGGGTLQIGNGSVNGTIGSGTYGIASGATLRLNYASASAPTWANISGSGTLSLKTAAVGDANWGTTPRLPATFTGTLQIESGRLYASGQVSASTSLGNASTIVVLPGGQLGMDSLTSLPQNLIIGGTGYGGGANDGALRIGATANLSGSVTLASAAAISVDNGQSPTFSGVISGTSTANVTIGGGSGEGGTAVFSNANTYSGNTIVSFGALKLANSAAMQNSTLTTAGIAFSPAVSSHAFVLGGLSGSGSITLNDGTNAVTVNVGNNNQSTTFSGVLSSSGGLTKIGSGILTLNAANTYTGTTTISNGTLQVGSGGSTGSLASTGSIVNNANLAYSFSTTTTLPNTNYSGSGSLTATSANINFTGNLAVGGAFNYSATGSGASGSTANSIVTASSASIAGGIYYNSGGPNTQQLTISTSAANGAIAISSITSGKAGVQFGFNNVDFNAGTGAVSITGTNAFNWWSNGASVEFDGQVSGTGSMSGGLQGGGNASLIFNNPGAGTYSGNIVGSFNLVKQGAGSQALFGANSYTGSTSITAGTLQVANGSLPSASAIAFGSGTTLLDARTNGNVANVVTGSGTWTLSAYGQGSAVSSTMNLSGFTGTMNLLSGARFWNNQGTNQYPGASATINISSGAEIGLASAGTCSATMNLAGTGQDGLGVLRFEGGAMAGTINLTAAAQIEADGSAGTLSGTVNNNGNTLTLYPNGANLNFTGSITGSGGLTQTTGGSSVNLSGSNSYGGLTSINAGSLNISGAMGSGGYSMTGGVVNFSGTQTITGANSLLIGFNAGSGIFNVTNGSLTNSGTVNAFIGQNGGTGVMNVSGGAYTDNNNNIVYIGNVTSGTLTVSGSGLVTENNSAQPIYLARASTSNTGAITLNGGTLATGRSITHDPGQSTGKSFVNFNGGTLQATASNSAWISGLTAVNVQNGGAIINTNGFNMGISQGLLASGTGGLTLLGGGQLTLNGSSTFTGGTTISAGTLVYGNANTLLSSGAVNVNGSSSVLELGGFSSSVGTLTLTAGTIQHGTLSGSTYAVQSGLISANLLGGSAALTQNGGGLVTLSGNNTFGGATTVSAGTLALSNVSGNNIASTPSITLSSTAAWLDATGLSGGAISLGTSQTLAGFGTVNGGVTSGGSLTTITPGSLTAIGTLSTGTLNLAAGASLNFVLGTAGSSALSPGLGSLINVAGSLTLPSTQIASLNLINNATANGQGSFGNGFYDLFNYTGTLTGSPSAAFGLGTGVKSYAYSTITSGSTSELILQVSVPTLNWTGLSGGTGAADSGWNLTSTNWSNSANNSAQAYLDGAIANFGDTNAVSGGSISNSTITISGSNVSPASVIFSNSAVNYTLNGSAGIAGATGITMNGTGVVSLQNSNSFTGPVTINAGAINISNSVALGSSSSVTVASGAALQIQGGITTNPVLLTLSGSGLAASPAGALNNVSGNNTYSGAIGLGSAATVASTAGTLTLSGGVATNGNLLTIGGSGATNVASQPISGNGGVFVAGPGTLILSVSNNYTGATTVNSGATLQLATTAAIPTGAAASNVTVNGTLDLNALNATVNGLSGTGSVSSVAGGTPTFSVGNNAASNTFAGVVSDGGGTMSLTKIGSGTQALSGPNTYSGLTTISAGTLQIGGGGTSGAISSTGSSADNSTLAFNRSDSYGGAYSGTISGTGSLTVLGGALSLSGSNTYSGLTTISAGTLAIGAGGTAGSIGATSSVSVASGATLDFNRTDNYGGNFTRLISGSGGLALSSGSLTLTAASTYSGPTTISAGTLNAATGALPAQSAINIAGSATLVDNRSVAQIANVITGSGTWNLSGVDRQWYATNSPNTENFSGFTGTLNLPAGARFWNGQGASQYPGAGATINIASSGQMSLANTGTCFANANIAGIGQNNDGLGALRFEGGTMAGSITLTAAARIATDGGGGTISGPINTNGNTLSLYAAINNLNVNGNISGSGGVANIGGNTVFLAGDNSGFSGTFTLSAGNLQLDSSGAMAGGGNVTFAGGTLQFSASNNLDYAAQIKNSASAAKLDTNGQTVTFAGAIDASNSGGLTKLGTGALVLQGSNSYGGSTTLSAGTLVMQGNSIYSGSTSLNAGKLVIAANSVVNTGSDGLIDSGPVGIGTLAVAGGTLSDDGNARTIANPVAITASTTFASTESGSLTFDPAGLATPSVMTISNNTVLTVNNNTTIKESISSSGSYISQSGTGMLTLAGTGNSTTGRFDVNSGTLAISSGSITLGSYFTLNTSGTAATYIQTGGTVNIASGFGAYINNSGGANGSVFTLSGGAFTVNGTADGFRVGNSGQGTASLSGGGIVTTPWTHVGAGSGASVLNLGDGASFSGGTSNHNGGTSGTLVTGYVSYAGASATVNFNGGTLKASGIQPNFMTGLTNAFVKDAGGIVDNGGFNITIAQPLQHGGTSATDGGLVFQGAGTTIISGTNGYNGGTTVSGGVLQLGNSSALGASSGNLTVNGGTLDLHGFSPTAGDLAGGSAGVITSVTGPLTLTVGTADSTTFAGAILNSGATINLTKNGSGALTLLGNNTYTGLTSINGGTLGLGNGGASGEVLGSVALSNNSAFVFNRSDDVDFTSTISGAGMLTKQGGGTLTVEGNNSYSNGTSLQAGTLLITNTSALGTGGLTANGGTLDLNGNSPTVASLAGLAGTITDGSSVSGATPLVVNQSASTTFGGSFKTGVNARKVSLLQEGSGSMTLSGINTVGSATVQNTGTLQITGSLTAGNVNVNAGAQLAGNGTVNIGSGGSLFYASSAASNFAGALVGPGAIEVDSGSLTLSGTNNSFAGGTAVVGGTLAIGANNALPTATTITFGNPTNGTLDLAGFSQTVAGLSVAATNASNQIIGNSSTSSNSLMTFDSSGSSDFPGTIEDSLGSGTMSTALAVSGGTLVLSGTNSFTGGTTVTDGALVLTDNEALADGTSLTVGDASAFAPAPVIPSVAAGTGFNTPAIAAVPEPGTFVLLAFGLWSAATYRRFRRKPAIAAAGAGTARPTIRTVAER